MKKIERYVLASIGMTFINIGISFVPKARIGSDCLTLVLQACMNNFGLTIGTWNTIFGVVFVLVAFICDRKKIGYSTIFYVATSKIVVDNIMTVLPDPNNYLVDILYCICAIIFISFGSAISISVRLGLGYYDAFCYSITDRFKINYVVFRYCLEGVFIVVSLLLHTYPGIGTIIYFVLLGPCLNFLVSKIKQPIRNYLGLKFEN